MQLQSTQAVELVQRRPSAECWAQGPQTQEPVCPTSCPRTSGLVVDVGESGTSIVPVRASLFCHLPAGSLQLLRPPHVQVVGGDQPHVI